MEGFDSKDQVAKAVHDIREDVQAKADRGDLAEMKAQLDAYKRDFKQAQQALRDEIAENSRYVASGSEAELRYYLDTPDDARGAKRGAYLTSDDSDRALRLVATPTEKGWTDYGLLDDPEPVHEWQHRLQRSITKRSIIRQALGPNVPTPRADREVRRALLNSPRVVSKIFTDSANAGAEWIPDVTAPELEREVFTPLGVRALFATRQLPASGVLKIPFAGFGLIPYKVGAGTTDTPAQYTASTLTTDERTITAVGLAVRAVVDDFSQEDAIFDAVDVLVDAIVLAMRMGEEDGIINGDTGTHGDTGIAAWNIRSRWAASMGSTADHRRRYIGLRHRAIDASTDQDLSSAETAAGIADLRASLGARGLGQCAVITSPEWMFLKMMTFDELETLDKAGSMATIAAPEGAIPVGMIYGMPVVVSDFMDIELNASGIYDDSTKTKTGALVVDRSRYEVAVRRGVTLERDKDITRQSWDVVATARTILRSKDSSTTKNVAYGYNLTTP